MKKYTANYSYTNPNFVIQNLVENPIKTELLPILYVIKNILQRGFPTTLSKYLQSQIGEIHKQENFNNRFLFATNETPIWYNTIKGDQDRNYYPAREFFEEIIPNEFGEYSFIQSLIIPEIAINTIIGEVNQNFINQQVDFYLPQAKLVIEIDGQQHKRDEVTRVSDDTRDKFLYSKGINTIRIDTSEFTTGRYKEKIIVIKEHLARYDNLLNYYKSAYKKIEENKISDIEFETKLRPTAIIRLQLLLIELLTHNYLTLDESWSLNILLNEDLGNVPELAINDLLIWIDRLWQLKYKSKIKKPEFIINITNNKSDFKPSTKAINIDFSLFKRYTDENVLNLDILFVRTDYFDIVKEMNYFRVSTAEPINYNITDSDKPVLEFFLQNIFDKPSFREGQFPIISNTLNRKDTIGLLPTGGGKSLCYQLPCLLQPSVNFVVCPIKSLMYDQYENMEKMLVTNVNFITSDLDTDQRRQIETDFELGKYLFVWISPEKFQIPSFREKIRAIIANFSIAYAVVDEVHCLSEWGHDFRTSYLNLAKTIDKLSPKDESGEGKIKFIGLTATASVNVLKDIKIEFSRQKQRLNDSNIKSLLDYSRKELQFEIINDRGNKQQQLKSLVTDLANTEGFTETNEKAGLIFTPNVNGAYGCFQVSNTLNTLFQNKVGWFSGDIPKRDVLDDNGRKIGTKQVMDPEEFKKYKIKIQKAFKNDEYPILVTTKAFGMGIDKQNIFYTIHYGLPSSVEALYQEAGRAGRWDKNFEENKSKVGKCFVLYSPETFDNERVEQLFHKDTNFRELRDISEEAGWDGKDVFKQLFLFIQGQNDIEEDFQILIDVIRYYFQAESKVNIFWRDAYSKLNITESVLQKVIYRLSLLGIVSDWTTDFVTHYAVKFRNKEDNNIIKNVSKYISKYEPTTQVSLEISKAPKSTILEKSIWYLLSWTFENIAYNRKQSLKTLRDWCSEFVNNENFGSEDFKRRIDSYFVFSDTTFILQDIGENPTKYKNWFEAFYIFEETNEIDENGLKRKYKIHIPDIIDSQSKMEEYEKLRDNISRFLESYRNNVGLNFLSGFVRLVLNDYEDTDGKERFESALESISQTFSKENQEGFFNRLISLGDTLNEEQKINMCLSIGKFFPNKLEFMADFYNLPHLLNEIYSEKLLILKTLNLKLYEQLAEI